MVGRGMVDTYLMLRVAELKHSLVDITYSTIMLHQGFENYNTATSRKNVIGMDKYYNEVIFGMHFLPKICMSIPGDWVVCRHDVRLLTVVWNNSILNLELWNRDVQLRERQREKYIAMIRSRIDQMPLKLL